MGQTPDEAFRHRPNDGRREYLARALAGETVAFNRRTLEGPHRGEWFRAHYFPLYEPSGAVWGVMVVLVDIQQLKATEAALGERERHLSLIMDAVGFPVTYVDRDRIVRFVNRPAAQWAGRETADMVGRSMDELMPPDVRTAVGPYAARAFAGEATTYERATLWPGHDSRRVRGHMARTATPPARCAGS
jgi:PAS domain S-box